jgi:FkbM family methyltransferase
VSRSPSLAARRARQTLTSFENGPRLLWDLASRRAPWADDQLTFRLPGGGVVLCPNLPGARVPVYEIFAEDAYRLDELFEGLQAPTVLDIGGHIGCFALAAARRDPGARVHTYEASPSTAAWLSRNVEANGLDDRITAHNVAVAGHHGTIEFADNDGGSSLNGLTAPVGSTHLVEVSSITVSEANADAGGQVDVVKIDTEGAEYDMVLASDPAAWQTVERVVLEYHDVRGHDWSELDTFFASCGLDVTALEAASGRQGTVWLSRKH